MGDLAGPTGDASATSSLSSSSLPASQRSWRDVVFAFGLLTATVALARWSLIPQWATVGVLMSLAAGVDPRKLMRGKGEP